VDTATLKTRLTCKKENKCDADDVDETEKGLNYGIPGPVM